MSDHIPVEAFLAAYPEPIAELGEQLCSVVLGVVPDAVERVRPGGRLIGYDAPGARRKRYFCYIALETKHIHLGFEHGATMRDPHQRLLGAGVTRQVRWLTYRPGDPVDVDAARTLVLEARRIALLPPADRLSEMLAPTG
jgi:hypothetical protein